MEIHAQGWKEGRAGTHTDAGPGRLGGRGLGARGLRRQWGGGCRVCLQLLGCYAASVQKLRRGSDLLNCHSKVPSSFYKHRMLIPYYFFWNSTLRLLVHLIPRTRDVAALILQHGMELRFVQCLSYTGHSHKFIFIYSYKNQLQWSLSLLSFYSCGYWGF